MTHASGTSSSSFWSPLGHEADVAQDSAEGVARFARLCTNSHHGFLHAGRDRPRLCRDDPGGRSCHPIVMISGSAAPPEEARAVALGLRFLKKPVRFLQLEAVLPEMIEYAGAR